MDQHDGQINWEQKYDELEQNTFANCFDDAIRALEKDDEIERLRKLLEETPLKEPTESIVENVNQTYKNAFIRQGDVWEIWYQGNRITPQRHLNGISYIANLIQHHEINAIDLYNAVRHQDHIEAIPDTERQRAVFNGDLSVSKMDDEKLDSEAKKSYKKKLAEYEEIMNDAECPQSEREKAKHDYEELIQFIKKTYGKKSLSNKTPRQQNEAVKKSYDTIKKSIYLTISYIAEKSPELADYLKQNLQYGNTFSFTDKSLAWHISL